MLTRSTLSEVLNFVQRTLADCTQFLCAGRAGFPEILQNFRPIFAQILRDLDAELACNLALERTPTQKKTCNEVLRFVQPRWPTSRSFYARGAPFFFSPPETSQFFRAIWAQNLRDPDAGRALFRIKIQF